MQFRAVGFSFQQADIAFGTGNDKYSVFVFYVDNGLVYRIADGCNKQLLKFGIARECELLIVVKQRSIDWGWRQLFVVMKFYGRNAIFKLSKVLHRGFAKRGVYVICNYKNV